MVNTFVYSPSIEIHIQILSGDIIDVTEDVTRAYLTQRSEGVSSLEFELQNAVRKYDGMFTPMDKVIVYMTRVKRLLQFSGYLNSVPAFTSIPGTVKLTASSTMKRLINFLWDPDVPDAQRLLRGDISQGQNLDSGVTSMAQKILTDVVGWPLSAIHIGVVPEQWFNYTKTLANQLVADSAVAEITALVGSGMVAGTGVSVGVTPSGTVSDSDIKALMKGAGFPESEFNIGVGIVHAESSAKPNATNTNVGGSVDYGLWQINSIHQGLLAGKDWSNPTQNTAMAFEVWKGAGWYAWTTYKDGAYLKFQAAAEAAPVGTGSNPVTPVAASNVGPPSPASAASANRANQVGAGNGIADPPADEAPYLSMTRQFLAAFPNGKVTSGLRYDDNGHHAYGQAIDMVPGPDHTLQDIANWVFQAYPNSAQEIYVNGPFQYHEAGNPRAHGSIDVDNSRQDYIKNGIYGASEAQAHNDHVHWASLTPLGQPGVAGPGGVGSPSLPGNSGSGSNTGPRALTADDIGSAIFNVFQWTTSGYSFASTLGGIRALMNDVPVYDSIQKIMTAGMRSFTSAPNGDFIAWFPDYFGQWGTAGKMIIEDIELMEGFSVAWSDEYLKTHVFVVGSLNAPVQTAHVRQATTAGIASVEYPELIKALFRTVPDKFNFADGAKGFLSRYGPRVTLKSMDNLNMLNGQFAHRIEFFFAVQHFMQNWAQQFSGTASLTFMPEVFPGMLLVFPTYGVQAYVKEVTHSYDSVSGFETVPILIAWSNVGSGGINGLVNGGAL